MITAALDTVPPSNVARPLNVPTNFAQVGGVCTRHGAKKKVKLCKVARDVGLAMSLGMEGFVDVSKDMGY